MNLPDDLRDYRAPLGAFQVLEEGAAFIVLMVLAVLAFIFSPYL